MVEIVTSQWFEQGVPIPVEYLRQIFQTNVFIHEDDGTKKERPATFFITDDQKIAEIEASGQRFPYVDRNFPPLVLVVMTDGRVFWTNLAEYALCFLIQRHEIETDIQDGFDTL